MHQDLAGLLTHDAALGGANSDGSKPPKLIEDAKGFLLDACQVFVCVSVSVVACMY